MGLGAHRNRERKQDSRLQQTGDPWAGSTSPPRIPPACQSLATSTFSRAPNASAGYLMLSAGSCPPSPGPPLREAFPTA
ncbi:hypothetical protein I79_006803 [Cricetulus griseus]|uniref:Uncharacterized protein n=1 Tax=Cricetulus griseus TaxID=10029 RepID=G3H8U2_CRIGR|nr:hypothetical protein I79_006803 [Cricetulus griseus]